MRETPPLFSYGTGVSLRAPARRAMRLPLVVALLALTALVAAGALAGVLWVATADYGALLASLRQLVSIQP